MATCCNTALVVQCSVIAYAMSASAAAVTRYQASLRSPHNALHSPSILLLLYIYYRTYVGVCVTPFFFFIGVRCAACAVRLIKFMLLYTKWIPLTRERSVYSAGENVKDLAALLKQLKNERKGLENEE